MRTSQFPLNTVKETPADAEIASHQLMIRAGLIRKLAAGLYSWLPLGLRVLRKVEKITREEMEKAGALEVLMPALQPDKPGALSMARRVFLFVLGPRNLNAIPWCHQEFMLLGASTHPLFSTLPVLTAAGFPCVVAGSTYGLRHALLSSANARAELLSPSPFEATHATLCA